jgi:sulfur relay (sulfurtransferase) complex TusBCD TusD component (DsrE family)
LLDGVARGAAHRIQTTKESAMSSLSKKTVFVFTSQGMGQTENAELKIKLAKKFLALIAEADPLPSQICFYTDGVKLCVNGSPVLDELRALAAKGVELVLCSTCLDTFGLRDQVAIGVVGGMGDIITAMVNADNTIAL